MTAFAAAFAFAAPAHAGMPTDPRCWSLGAGSTGLFAVGGELPSEAQLSGRRGGFGPVATVPGLPNGVRFKTTRETFSNEYAFALRDGVRLRAPRRSSGVPRPGEAWHVLELPGCLDGRISEISAPTTDCCVAIGPDRQIYAHDMPGGDLAAERWTWRWGPLLLDRAGAADARRRADLGDVGVHLRRALPRQLRPRRRRPIGVATVYLLRDGGRRITYLDPWLPNDESREVCGPRRGTVALANLVGERVRRSSP